MHTDNMYRFLIFIFLVIFIHTDLHGQTGSAALSAVHSTSQNTEDGTTLAAEICSIMPEKETVLRGSLKRRSSGGEISISGLKSHIIPANHGWISVYETTDDNGNIKERLIIKHSRNNQNNYVHELYSGNNKKVAENPDLSTSFSDSDFSLGDLGLEFLYWKKQTILKTEMRKSRVCKVLESIPDKVDKNLGYSKVVSWIDRETLGILIAEAYDNTGKKVKQFEVSSFRKDENGLWQIQELEIRNLKTRTKTQLVF